MNLVRPNFGREPTAGLAKPVMVEQFGLAVEDAVIETLANLFADAIGRGDLQDRPASET